MLYDAVAGKYASDVEFKVLPVAWFDGLLAILRLIEASGVWPEGDCWMRKMVMIPKAEGNLTPLELCPLSVLPIVYRLWATVRLGHLQAWCDSWLPESVFECW